MYYGAIWEADLIKGTVQASKLDITDAYHCITLWPDQVLAFDYAIPSVAVENCVIICTDLVLTMR